MKTIANLLENYQPSKEHKPLPDESKSANAESGKRTQETYRVNALTQKTMGRFWEKMISIYGHKWSSSHGEAADEDGKLSTAAATWQAGLGDIPLECIRRGLEKCLKRADSWPPSLPEFRALCQGNVDDLGLPSVGEAYRQAVMQKPDWENIHPIVWFARVEADSWALTRLPESQAWPRFKAVYERLVQRAMAGEVFEYPDTALKIKHEKPRAVTSPGDAKAHLSEIRRRLKGVV